MKTILLADDEPNLRVLVRTTLEDGEHRILEASDGWEALSLARGHLPDLVILDWMMPGMTGLEVAIALREEDRTAGIPVLMLTAKGQESDRLKSREVGVDAYLTKPFSPLDLMERARDLLAIDESRP